MRFSNAWFAVTYLSLVTAQLSTPILNFEGVGNYADNFELTGGGINVPPDTVGSVGPNHYVQATNVAVKIFDKAGNVLTRFAIGNLWNVLGGPCASNNGDPDVLYDQFEDRFIITQFTRTSPNNDLCIAVSKTPDPTGEYWVRCCAASIMFLAQYIVF